MTIENEDSDPVGAADPEAVFRQLAEQVGLIRPGDPLDRNVIELCFAVVERCASIGDAYDGTDEETNAGEHIRADLGAP